MVREHRTRILQALGDFGIILMLSAAFLITFLVVEPYKRGFFCDDQTIRFPLAEDTVPLYVAGLYGAVSALLVIIAAELYMNRPCCRPEEEYEAHNRKCILNSIHGLILYCLGAVSTMLITEVGKRTIGRLRPHFIAVCKPNFAQLNCFQNVSGVLVGNYIPFDEYTCTATSAHDKHLIREARVSFPSGHSSFSCYSMLFIILYLEARVVLKRARFAKAVAQLIAFIAAWHTCLSRVSDHKHHYTDVIAGAFLGLSVAIFVILIIGKRLWPIKLSGFDHNGETAVGAEEHCLETYDL